MGGRVRRVRVDPALVAPGRLGGQAVPARGPRHRQHVEVRRLEDDLGRRAAQLGVLPAHHAGQADRPGVVGDQQVGGIEGPGHPVQGDHRLARTRPAHHDAALQGGGVVRVQRLTGLEHHVVGDIDTQ
ncbi:hypothetical protein SDC9_129995 [bioreactor metagenome]|uniref:Uncharacterized protein n=1 Tax=bioreactor metagenome TaxID=1076179 RepID=A0A645D1H6_9ZZZZ